MNRKELLKSAKPILFNTEMVQALLDGKKTVTRRVIKPQPQSKLACVITHECDGGSYWSESNYIGLDTKLYKSFEIGDILYVRETFCNVNKPEYEPEYYYLADTKYVEDYNKSEWKWRPSLHMPKEAARIFLKVTYVRVERLQEMCVDDAINEGAWGGGQPSLPVSLLYEEHPTASCNAVASFAHIWDSTIKKEDLNKYGWEANPWVWVIEFERYEKLEEK